MSNLVPIDAGRSQLGAPTKMQQRMAQGKAMNDQFSSGVGGGFLVLSIRSSKFHIRNGQDEKTVTDPQTGYAAAYLDVVLVNASKNLSKAFYVNAYSQGNVDQPDCWSLDSIRPDPSVQNKQNPTCGDCPMNAFGSKITPDGKAAKACADHRRVAVTFPSELAKPDPTPLMLRVPQSSLKNLRNYVDVLQRNGYEPGGCVTRLSFDTVASWPKLQFQFVGPVTDQEFDGIESMIDSANVKAMLQGVDFANNATQPAQGGLQPMQRQAPVTIEGTGFGPGMANQQPVQQPQPQRQQAIKETVQALLPSIIELPDGKLFDTVNKVYVEPEEEAGPELDPDVIELPDGKFYHKTLGTYVAGPYVSNQTVADAAPAQAEAPAEPVKRKRRSSAEVAAEKAAKATAASPPPEVEAKPNGNGQVVDKPTVVAASPKLENLLAGLAPPKK